MADNSATSNPYTGEYAGSRARQRTGAVMFREPMMATAVERFPAGIEQTHVAEPKLDGWRGISAVTEDGAWIATRTGKPITSVPYINEALALSLPANTVLDGEILDTSAESGRSWNRTQMILSRNAVHQPTEQDPPLTYVVFDILAYSGADLTGLPLADRKQALTERFNSSGLLALDTGWVTLGTWEPARADAFERAVAAGYEGVVIKDLASSYSPGARGPAWLKLKATHTEDVVIIGLPRDGEGRYAGQVGAIEFRLPNGATGRCSGMSDSERREMTEHPQRWLGQTVEVKHQGVTVDGLWRHPRYVRRRLDREPATSPRELVPDGGPPPVGAVAGRARRMRNYASMGDAKLLGCLRELEDERGDAFERCLQRGSGCPQDDLSECRRIAAQRGLQ